MRVYDEKFVVLHDTPCRVLFTVSDGKVTLGEGLDLSAVSALPLPYLLALREIVNTAVYDAERRRGAGG